MTYVALSRGVSISRMKIRNFSIRGVRTNPKQDLRSPSSSRVIQFYREAATAPLAPAVPVLQRGMIDQIVPIHTPREQKQDQWLSCPAALKKPFVAPSKADHPSTDLDLEGWKALYDNTFCKTVEFKERNRFHTGLIREAESAKDNEKPELPLRSVQNALMFKRMNTRRQVMGSLLLHVCQSTFDMLIISTFLISFLLTYLIIHIIHSKITIHRLLSQVSILLYR